MRDFFNKTGEYTQPAIEYAQQVNANIDWLNNSVSAVMGVAIGASILIPSWIIIKRRARKEKEAIQQGNLIDDNCPLLETHYIDNKQRIRSRDDINLRKVFTTHADIYVDYIHQAAEEAFKSENPNLFYHLGKVIPEEEREKVMYDIQTEIRKYIGTKMYAEAGIGYGPNSHPESIAYIVMVAEQHATRQQIRFLLIYDEDLKEDRLPLQDNVMIEVGPNEYEKGHHHESHLATRRLIVNQLRGDPTLRKASFVAYPKQEFSGRHIT